jgi:uncharacterized GH25 family protein
MRTARLLLTTALFFLALPTMGAISGTVIDGEGRPIAAAKVSIFAMETRQSRVAGLLSKTPERTPLATAATNADGAFVLASPSEAVVDLQADARGYAPRGTRVERNDDDVVLMLPNAAAKQGSVTVDGKPVPGAMVIWSGNGAEAIVRTDGGGKYAVVDPAQWANTVLVIHPDYAFTEQRTTAGREPQRLLRIDAGVPVTGRATGADGTTPVAGAALTIDGFVVAETVADGAFRIAHAPRQWTLLEVRKGDLIGVRANNTKPAVVRLGPAAAVAGVVSDAKSGKPLAGAEVRLARPGALDVDTLTATTDAKGAFSFAAVRPGSYVLTTARPGYAAASASVSASAAQTVRSSLAARPLARISGIVTDEDKHGLSGISIDVRAATQVAASEIANGHSVSGPGGRFVVLTATQGGVVVVAAKRGLPPARSSVLRVAAGERKSGINLTIPRGIALSGRVVDPAGAPLNDVRVSSRPSQHGSIANEADDVRTAADGTFTLRLLEGLYDLTFRHDGYAPAVRRSVRVSEETRPLQVRLDRGVAISGIVTRAGKGVEGIGVAAAGDNDVLAQVTTSAAGDFTIADLAPGAYMLQVRSSDGDGPEQLKAVTAPARNIVIELPAFGRIAGHVTDKSTHAPVTSFELAVTSRSGGGSLVVETPPLVRTFTGEDGSFALDDVPGGTVQIVAKAAGYAVGRAPAVIVEEGKSAEGIEIALVAGVRLTGRVTGPDDAPLSAALVRLETEDDPSIVLTGPISASTDAEGRYALDGLEPGRRSFRFSHDGFMSVRRTAQLATEETHLDVRLTTGTRIGGIVVTEAGSPVADATVRAVSAVSAGYSSVTGTDSSGTFAFEDMAAGHYTFTASRNGYADALLRDVDVSAAVPLRLTLTRGGTLSGHVRGLADAELTHVAVTVRGSGGDTFDLPVDSSGNFRTESAPAGTLRVFAKLTLGFNDLRMSATKAVEMAAGGSAQVELEFDAQTEIRGRVTRDGKPLASASVQFLPHPGATASTAGRSTTDDNGNYSVKGLADSPYDVTVLAAKLSAYPTSYDVHGSGTFDIDIQSAAVRGRITDKTTHEPIADAAVQLRINSNDNTAIFTQRRTSTDGAGLFLFDAVAAGPYVVTANKPGYSAARAETVIGTNAPSELALTMSKDEGISVDVLDARDHHLLIPFAVVYDAAGLAVFDTQMTGGSDVPTTLHIPVGPGQYRAVIGAGGYAPQTVTVTSPSQTTLGLTPGGTLLIHSFAVTPLHARLRTAAGIYTRPFSRDGIFTITGATTTVANIQPGAYRLEVLDTAGNVALASEVIIAEGIVTNVDL